MESIWHMNWQENCHPNARRSGGSFLEVIQFQAVEEAVAHVDGQWLRNTLLVIQVDRLLQRIHDNAAVLTACHVALDLSAQVLAQFAVDIIGEGGKQFTAALPAVQMVFLTIVCVIHASFSP
jgi:hypothetical protein